MAGDDGGRPGREARRRPGRRRPRGAAGRRGRRRGPRGRHRLLRPVPRGRPARGLQGVRQGGDGRRRRADRRGPASAPPPTRSRPRSTRSGRRTSSRTTGSPPARASWSPTTGRPRSTTPPAASGWWSRSSSTGPRSRCSRITDGADASTRSSRPRTSSGSSTATPARTPAAWAPTPRCRGRRPAWSTRCCAPCCSRPSTRWPAAARRSAGCCTPGWRSPRAAPGWSSSTPGSATPRPSRC